MIPSLLQLTAFSKLQFSNGKQMIRTYRPVQPLNGRQVYYSRGHVGVISTFLLIISVIGSFTLSFHSTGWKLCFILSLWIKSVLCFLMEFYMKCCVLSYHMRRCNLLSIIPCESAVKNNISFVISVMFKESLNILTTHRSMTLNRN